MLRAFAEFVVEVVCIMTGHGVLWALTLGRWKPFERHEGLACFVGLMFWAGLGTGVFLAFSR